MASTSLGCQLTRQAQHPTRRSCPVSHRDREQSCQDLLEAQAEPQLYLPAGEGDEDLAEAGAGLAGDVSGVDQPRVPGVGDVEALRKDGDGPPLAEVEALLDAQVEVEARGPVNSFLSVPRGRREAIPSPS